MAASGWAPPIPPSPPVTTSLPLERASEVLPGTLREGLIGSLEDSLGSDVDPRARGHLTVHGQPESIEPAELFPGGPAGYQVRIGDEHPGGLLVGPKDPNRLPALHQQCLVVLQPAQRGDDPLVALPVPRRLPPSAVDDQLLGSLRHGGIQVVHQHPKRGLLVPPFTGDGGAARGGNSSRVGQGSHVVPQAVT